MQQQPANSSARPYRSHARPACMACRRRKSRCKVEAHATTCSMCSVHGTPCEFRPGSAGPPRTPPVTAAARRAAAGRSAVAQTSTPTPTPTPTTTSSTAQAHGGPTRRTTTTTTTTATTSPVGPAGNRDLQQPYNTRYPAHGRHENSGAVPRREQPVSLILEDLDEPRMNHVHHADYFPGFPADAEHGPAVAQAPAGHAAAKEQSTPLSLDNGNSSGGGDDDDDDNANPHIVGPVVSNDNHVLADYLASIHAEARGMRITRPAAARAPFSSLPTLGAAAAAAAATTTTTGTPHGPGSTEPVLFTHVHKRPLGMTIRPNASSLKLQTIEKLLEPWTDRLVEIYLAKNLCFPLVDEASFRRQYTTARHRVSPALLSTLYASTLTFWPYDLQQLAAERCPDGRFVWNLASEALYAELYAAPGLATLPAVLLNVGGRPTTSMIGNGVQLGVAVALSHALGLNRNPLSWDVPQTEKHLRMKIWWCLLVHDRWTSLAYGTPPHIRRAHYDVPPPIEAWLCDDDGDDAGSQSNAAMRRATSRVFIALVNLTEVLAPCLDYVFDVERAANQQTAATMTTTTTTTTTTRRRSQLALALHAWVEQLPDDVRRIVVRGTQLATPGASNLRLAYLSRRPPPNPDPSVFAAAVVDTDVSNRYMEIRRSAEEIVRLVQELDHQQLGDFWLPGVAFTFAQTVAFLARCALEESSSSSNGGGGGGGGSNQHEAGLSLAQSPSLRLASELVEALRQHQTRSGWDLADLCLAQHADVIQRLLTTTTAAAATTETATSSTATATMATATTAAAGVVGEEMTATRDLQPRDEPGNQPLQQQPQQQPPQQHQPPQEQQHPQQQQHQQHQLTDMLPSAPSLLGPPYGMYNGAFAVDTLFPSIWDTLQSI
ncbi:Transcription factor [Niveomyces insectorum RCEF 264]|uniref:Transcription factor n=1 Tax=Niveomyces insectorum RCEF 264 TaxID=1081102 RepID=A0A167S3W9_9HYPO|nr:Transcription factor [Niveomyces insectorum RCEF 264]